MSTKPLKVVKIVYNCTQCGESVEIDFTKRDLKQMLKMMNLPLETANKIADFRLMKQRMKESVYQISNKKE